MLAYAAVLPVLSGWTCARGMLWDGAWCGGREYNMVWTAPYNQWSGYPPLEPSGKELGHVLADVPTRRLC